MERSIIVKVWFLESIRQRNRWKLWFMVVERY